MDSVLCSSLRREDCLHHKLTICINLLKCHQTSDFPPPPSSVLENCITTVKCKFYYSCNMLREEPQSLPHAKQQKCTITFRLPDKADTSKGKGDEEIENSTEQVTHTLKHHSEKHVCMHTPHDSLSTGIYISLFRQTCPLLLRKHHSSFLPCFRFVVVYFYTPTVNLLVCSA